MTIYLGPAIKVKMVVFEKNNLVKEELKEFSKRIDHFQNENPTEEEGTAFKGRRLMQGVYGQRQPGEQMMRIKVPGGALNSLQFKTIADIAKEYSHGILHITTRQDIQLHYLKLANVPAILEKLSESGLTTREACGNSIRNVSASPYTGLLRSQVFDVTSTVKAVSQFFLRNPDTQELPRKFKIGFSENEDDHAVTGMHDLGAIAVIREGRPGFKVVVGGGLGSQPFAAAVYSEFIRADELLPHFLAIARVYNRHGERVKRMKARIKFLVHKKWNIDQFIEECHKEVDQIHNESIDFPEINTEVEQPQDYDFSNPFDPNNENKLYLWFKYNVIPTVKKDQYMVLVQTPLGDITPKQTYDLCDFVLKKRSIDDPKSHVISITDDQNLVLRNMPINPSQKKEELKEIYDSLESLGLAMIGAHDMSDPVSCPGTSTCNLGITHSKGLARAIRKQIQERLLDNPRYKKATIHMSGCPNSCGRHHVSTIGFFGRSDQIDENTQAPAYGVLIGGGNKGNGEVVIAKRCGKILAKRIPDFIDTFMTHYEKNAQNGESFVDFSYRISKEEVNDILDKFTKEEIPPSKDEKINYDWDKDKPYVVEFGEGECAV